MIDGRLPSSRERVPESRASSPSAPWIRIRTNTRSCRRRPDAALPGDRHDAPTLLAGAFGDQLLDPQAKRLDRGGGSSVSLSRPASAQAPIARPSATAGLVNDEPSGSAAATIATLQPTIASSSCPISAAGTSPKNETAEYRPPMSDGLMKTSRKCSAYARRASSVPSSVMATK